MGMVGDVSRHVYFDDGFGKLSGDLANKTSSACWLTPVLRKPVYHHDGFGSIVEESR